MWILDYIVNYRGAWFGSGQRHLPTEAACYEWVNKNNAIEPKEYEYIIKNVSPIVINSRRKL